MLTVLVCVALALLSDAPLKELANPAVPENPAKAPWYFLGLQELVSYSAFMGGIGIPTIVLLGLRLDPVPRPRDGRAPASGSAARAAARWCCASAVFGLGGGARASRRSRSASAGSASGCPAARSSLITLVNPGTVLTAIYARVLDVAACGATTRRAPARSGCSPASSAASSCLTVIGTYFRGPNWDFYWSPRQWPGH